MNRLVPLEVSISQRTLNSGDMPMIHLQYMYLGGMTRFYNATFRQDHDRQYQCSCHDRLVNNKRPIISCISPFTNLHHSSSNPLMTRLRLLFPFRMERSKARTGSGSLTAWQLVDLRSQGPRKLLEAHGRQGKA
jgi:hypothetical protein